MSWSLVETRSLAIKAGRGVGLPWGMAEEAGFAVHWLQRFGLPGATVLAHYLTLRDSGVPFAPIGEVLKGKPHENTVCPLSLGTAISDQNGQPPGVFEGVAFPLLLVPFLALTSESCPSKLTWEGMELTFCCESLAFEGDNNGFMIERATCEWRVASPLNDVSQLHERVVNIAGEELKILQTFAHRNYAPATEQSRLAGAGAGLSDND